MDWAGEATALGEQEDGEREVARARARALTAPLPSVKKAKRRPGIRPPPPQPH